jgi:hypothetical protein
VRQCSTHSGAFLDEAIRGRDAGFVTSRFAMDVLTPAVGFEAIARAAKARCVLGLSATVPRKDGHHPIIFMPMRSGPSSGRCPQAGRGPTVRPHGHFPAHRVPAGQAENFLLAVHIRAVRQRGLVKDAESGETFGDLGCCHRGAVVAHRGAR